MTKAAPAGWYPNPENPTQQRYWDGSAWTEHVALTAATAATAPSECTQCGASIRSGAKVCEYCGAHVRASELESVMDYHQERHRRELEARRQEADAVRAAKEAEQRRENTKKAWVLGLVVAFLIADLLFLGSLGSDERGMVVMPAASSEYKGDNYKEAQADLRAFGFTSVEATAVPNLILGVLKPGQVKEVSINGQTDWDEGSRFPKDAIIVIRYHDFPVKK